MFSNAVGENKEPNIQKSWVVSPAVPGDSTLAFITSYPLKYNQQLISL